jgi:hypothetical protein
MRFREFSALEKDHLSGYPNFELNRQAGWVFSGAGSKNSGWKHNRPVGLTLFFQ